MDDRIPLVLFVFETIPLFVHEDELSGRSAKKKEPTVILEIALTSLSFLAPLPRPERTLLNRLPTLTSSTPS
jgi:hypothetical protein